MSKTTNNDDRIQELKKQIDSKLSELPKISKDFNTNLILVWHDNTYNLNVLPTKTLQDLLINLFLYQTAIDSLKICGFDIGGYIVEDWIADITKLIDIKNREQRVRELKESYNKLNSLLSETAKTSEFLDDVENLLNG